MSRRRMPLIQKKVDVPKRKKEHKSDIDPQLLNNDHLPKEPYTNNDILQLQRMVGNQQTIKLLANTISNKSTENKLQRLFGIGEEKPKEISSPYESRLNGEKFEKSDVKDKLGYKEDPKDVKPTLSFEDLTKRAEEAENTSDPLIKAQFLKYFSEHYAPHLTGEIEYFQFLAQKVAYMDLQPGDLIGANIDTKGGSKIDEMLEKNKMDKASDEKSTYSTQYVVESKYSNDAGLNAFLVLPSDGNKKENAIVLFRGTGSNTMGKERGESSGVMADTDYGGVGRVAFYNGLKVMKGWLDTAKDYNRITISGHSLGGALAERFYVMASKSVPDKLRLLTYQGAAIDRLGTVGDVMGEKDPQKKGAKATRVVARGDIVPLGGMAHVPGQKLKYSESDGKKYNPYNAHVQIDLVKQQLNESLEKPIKEVTNVVSKEKTGGTNFTKTALTAGKHLTTLIGHSFMVLSPYHLYKNMKSSVDKGKETN